MDAKDRALIDKCLNATLARVAVTRQKLMAAKTTLTQNEKALKEALARRPTPSILSPDSADEQVFKQAAGQMTMDIPGANTDLVKQLNSAIQKLSGGCDCPNLKKDFQ